MTPDQLRNKAVLRYMLHRHAYRDAVDAALAVALEEAAKVAEVELSHDHDESTRVATAIRAMIGKPQ